MTRVMPVLVALVLAVYAFIDCLQTDSSRIRSLNKVIWVAIIVLIPVIGPILWLAAGKHRESRRGPVQRFSPPQPPPPDDNPEFLRELRNLDDEHEKLLNEWEDSLRRREEEMRGQGEDDGTAEDTGTKPDEDTTARDEPPSADELDKAEEELRKQRGDRGDDESR